MNTRKTPEYTKNYKSNRTPTCKMVGVLFFRRKKYKDINQQTDMRGSTVQDVSHNMVENNIEVGNNNMDKYLCISGEVEMKKKKVQLTLQFPKENREKDRNEFEQILKRIYLDKLQNSYLQPGDEALSSQSQYKEGGK